MESQPPEHAPDLPVGVEAMEHTADLGLLVRAPSLEELFRRAAAGMLALMEDTSPPAGSSSEDSEARPISLEAVDADTLLVQWLRELLYLYQVGGCAYSGVEFDHLSPQRLEGRIRCRDAGPGVREIKGVTHHDLEVTSSEGEWRARVVFDV